MESLSYDLSRMSLNCLCGGCVSNGDMCPSVWSNLPHDLAIQLFFSRLPPKLLLEFRCLSKASDFAISQLYIPKLAASAHPSGFVFQWETVYDSEYYWENRRRNLKPFVHEWFYGYVTRGGSFDISGDELVRSFLASLPFKPQKDAFWGCFNGFLLVSNTCSDVVPVQYYVFNPATRQIIEVPINPAHLEGDSFAGLAYDLLGRPPHNFKIVRVSRCPESNPPELDIFSSITGKWVKHHVHLEKNRMEILGSKWVKRAVYHNGLFYMLSMAKYLLCFDLRDAYDRHENKLTPRTIKLPGDISSDDDDCLGLVEVSDGCLYYASEFDSKLLVWTYQASDVGFSPWNLKYSINFGALDLHFTGNRCIVFAVDLCNEIIYIGSKYMAYSYNVKMGQLKAIRRMVEGNIYCAESRFYAYAPSLVKLSQPTPSAGEIDYN